MRVWQQLVPLPGEGICTVYSYCSWHTKPTANSGKAARPHTKSLTVTSSHVKNLIILSRTVKLGELEPYKESYKA